MAPDDELCALVQAHGPTVDRYLRTVEMDAETREEHWSDVFTVAFRRLNDLRSLTEGQVRGWLLTTARNLVRNEARRAATRRQLIERLASQPLAIASSAEDHYLDSTPDTERLSAAWSSLSTTYQQVLTLSANGADGHTISAQLGITYQAARSRLMRARATFLDAYERCGATP